jgi:hypothetical protein
MTGPVRVVRGEISFGKKFVLLRAGKGGMTKNAGKYCIFLEKNAVFCQKT